MIIVTGGAGFIGSALVWGLNERGEQDILIVDDIDHDEKEHNLAELHYEQLVGIKDFRSQLMARDFDDLGVTTIFHLGACSSTTEQNWEYLKDNNVEYTQDIIRWCVDKGVRCIYASSAATYGDGAKGYSDDHKLFDQLKPLNLYGKSKLDVDIWARDAGYLDQIVGLRYFNVFGPNEWHKEKMRSVVASKFETARDDGLIELFKSNEDKYKDGEQMRDFVYVKDAVAATLWFMDNPQVNGVFNIGTGQARTFNDLAKAMLKALKKSPNIKYIDMSEHLSKQYQNYTQADMSKMKAAGFTAPATSLDAAVADYVENFLVPHAHLTSS